MKPILKYEDRSFFSEAELKQRVAEIHAEHEGEEITGAARLEWNKLNETIEHFQARRDRIVELARSGRASSTGLISTFPPTSEALTATRRFLRTSGPHAMRA